jgi:dolichol kinase
MTALTQTAPPADELLLSAARDIGSFLTEIRRINTADDSWRSTISAKCKALNERLSGLHARLENQVRGARTAIENLRSALTEYLEDITNGAGLPGLEEFLTSMGRRYDELMETLRSRRLTLPAELERELAELTEDRTPKLKRAAFHILMGVACAGLYQFVLDKRLALTLLGSFVLFFGAVELLRRYSKPLNDFWTDRIFGAVGRPQERYRINSASYYMWGMALIAVFAPKPIVCAALLVLAFGDPIASAVGHRISLYRFKNGKSLGGTLAFFVATSLLAGLYLALYSGLSTPVWIGLAACMALGGALSEQLSGKLDDNLVIPIATAGTGMLFLFSLGYPAV